MGVEHDIKRCIEVVESETDDVMRVTRLLPELAYVRAPRVIAHLRRYLDSERGLPPVRGRGKGVAYAQRAAALLAKVLPDFPVKQYVGGYSEEDIEACRKWMAVWEQRRTVPPKTPAESKPSSRVSADEVPKDANLAISGESEGAASVNAQPWLTSAPVEHTTEARTIERASSNAVAFVASPQEQQARLLAGSRKWAYVCVGVAASLAVGAAGAWRLLRRRSGA